MTQHNTTQHRKLEIGWPRGGICPGKLAKKTFAPHISLGWQERWECYAKCLELATSFRIRIIIIKKVKIPPITEDNLSTGGGLPLRLLMDDEEEDMFRPISRCWGSSPFVDVTFEDRATQTNSSAIVLPRRAGGGGGGMLSCRLAQEPGPFLRGNAGFRWHFPALFEPSRGLGRLRALEEDVPEEEAPRPREVRRRRRREQEEVQEEEEEEAQGEEGPRLRQEQAPGAEERGGEAPLSVEAQIGRKLRDIGDHFNQEQLQLFARHQRDHLPLWWRMGAAVFGYLLQRVDLAPGHHGNPR
ncbi:BCL2 modifying factor 2 [Engraulis encrasicolus]|uniref:BCL2 modifying factor 2 n=1 Tax=Engraulis encrasicolus TaxID=184585 RepID=UPI002FCF4196